MPRLEFAGYLDYAVVRKSCYNIPVILTIEAKTSNMEHGKSQLAAQIKACYEVAKSLRQKQVEQSVIGQAESDILKTIQETSEEELPPELGETERKNRSLEISKRCRKEAAIKRRKESEAMFTKVTSSHPVYAYGVATTAKIWTFMRYDGRELVLREPITVQNVQDCNNVKEIMTIINRILHAGSL